MRVRKIALALLLALALAGCGQRLSDDAARGASAVSRYGCGSCHTIGGIVDAHGAVGPPLTGLRNRMYVAGMVPNTQENLVHWIRFPKQINPGTAMPQLGVTERDASDIAAYIYSIR
jgi:cytochrome c